MAGSESPLLHPVAFCTQSCQKYFRHSTHPARGESGPEMVDVGWAWAGPSSLCGNLRECSILHCPLTQTGLVASPLHRRGGHTEASERPPRPCCRRDANPHTPSRRKKATSHREGRAPCLWSALLSLPQTSSEPCDPPGLSFPFSK